ncbi:MAG: formate dehydrogenase accessory sulfurtransferase FdhD [Flavobacteriaceae bacterium]|nr:formate dehydrogenase accessory sulfurtransferase FdhD [Flavobacteriaceae bacterium]MDG1327821.1 formate dehydrogenase accessory sulfurtransferase FdhD [Flavobacteriaceae bacterium]
MATRKYQGKKFENSSSLRAVDSLTVEEALQININNNPFTVSMRTPGDDISLVRGMLHSEGILKNSTFTPDLILKKENDEGIVTIVDLTIPKNELGEGYLNSRSLLSVSSCGICGRTELGELSFLGKTIDDTNKIDIAILNQLFIKMNNLQHSFHQSGGTHAAAAFSLEGKLLFAMEDIGRHNAVDKIIGKLILSEQLKKASVLTVSGRVSYEIVVKCFKAGIPFLAAVSAPSSLAVDYAKELGITLFAFCRDNRATCYSNPHRIKQKNTKNKAC